MESFGFAADLRRATQANAWSRAVLHHWDTMDGNVLDIGSKVGQIVRGIRIRKGLRVCITSLLSKYLAVFLYLIAYTFVYIARSATS
jgi:elongation factor 2